MLKRPSYRRRPCVPRPSRSRKLRLIKPSDKQQLLLIDADMPQPELGCAATRSWPRRSCRSWQQRYRQRGQALPEMLVVAGAMALLWIGVQELSSMRMAVLEAAQSSRHWAFALARAHTPPAKDEGMHLAVLEVAQAHDSAISADARTLARDWLDLPGRWAAVRAWAGQGNPERYTVVSAGAGHSSGATSTQQRLQRSTLGWRGSAAVSLRQASRLDKALAGLDHPWGQRRISTDWLSPWADVTVAGTRALGKH